VDPIRVLIADDHALVRMALRTLLEGETDFEVVGEAANTDDAIEIALRLRPDVLVLDMRMPGRGGIEVCRAVKDANPDTAVLVLTSFDDDEELYGALDAGADGYLMKDIRPGRVPTAIRAVYEGQSVFDSAIASRIVAGKSTAVGSGDLVEPLSDRELEVLALMARGLSNRDIAQSLWLGESTVKTHVSHVMRKLAVNDRTSAVLKALRGGLVQLDVAEPQE
jgi:DNA-binding NarL/FixJ family response regulator